MFYDIPREPPPTNFIFLADTNKSKTSDSFEKVYHDQQYSLEKV